MDVKFLMSSEIQRIRAKVRPKIKALLRTRPYYDMLALVTQFKTHCLCIIEGSTGAIYHAASSHLESLDDLQQGFVHQLRLTEAMAFLGHNEKRNSLQQQQPREIMFHEPWK